MLNFLKRPCRGYGDAKPSQVDIIFRFGVSEKGFAEGGEKVLN
jgi:hypothetical protein